MHLNLHFTAVLILWTLKFAALLVLLVVLLGRDRAKRFPWFTLSIALIALQMLAGRLLVGRMSTIALDAIFIIMADVSAIVGFMVIVEMGRRAFAPMRRGKWLAWALAVLVVGGGVLAFWGPWPPWKTLTADSFLADLRLMQMAAQKLDMLVDLLTVELGLLVIVFGRRFGAGWRTHTQRVVIGLSTASTARLAVQAIWQYIAKTAVPHSQAEYDHIIGLRDKLFNANGVVYVGVLVWWIIVLWMDEPGAAVLAQANTPQLEYLSDEGELPVIPDEPSIVPVELADADEESIGTEE
jgi:hypothetical protein